MQMRMKRISVEFGRPLEVEQDTCNIFYNSSANFHNWIWTLVTLPTLIPCPKFYLVNEFYFADSLTKRFFDFIGDLDYRTRPQPFPSVFSSFSVAANRQLPYSNSMRVKLLFFFFSFFCFAYIDLPFSCFHYYLKNICIIKIDFFHTSIYTY